MVQPVQMGKRTRMSFARIEEALAVPDLIEVQKNSYKNFLQEGLREVLADVSPITDYSESLILEFTDYSLDSKPKYTVEKCKERDTTVPSVSTARSASLSPSLFARRASTMPARSTRPARSSIPRR